MIFRVSHFLTTLPKTSLPLRVDYRYYPPTPPTQDAPGEPGGPEISEVYAITTPEDLIPILSGLAPEQVEALELELEAYYEDLAGRLPSMRTEGF